MGVVTSGEDEDHSSRDEIRKRALLALEGRASAKPSVMQGYAQVEIPDWNTPTHEKTLDWDPREYIFLYSLMSTNGLLLPLVPAVTLDVPCAD